MSTSTISDMRNSTSYDGLLKNIYLPTMTETLYEDAKFTALIQKTADNIDYEGQKVIHAFGTQRSAGVGAISEGGAWVSSVPVKGKQGSEQIKYLNAYIELTGPLIRAAKSERGSYSPAVARHFKTNIISQRQFFERMLMGDATGKLGTVVSTTAASNTITISGEAFFDTMHFEPGQKIKAVSGTTYGTYHTYDGTNAEMTVLSVSKGDKIAGTNGSIIIAEDLDGSSDIAAGDVIVLSSAYSGSTCQEINGMQHLVGNTEATIWGLPRATTDYLQSYVRALNLELDEDVLLDVMLTLENSYQATPNLLLVCPRGLNKYFKNVIDDRRFNVTDALEWTGGYKGLGIQLGTNKLMLTSLPSMPTGMAYFINTNDFAFATMSNGWEWILGDGGNVLVQSHLGDSKFASAINYLQFVCYDPMRQCKLTNITV